MRTWIFCFGIMLLSVCKVQAQNDPVLAGMIYAYTDKAEKELKNQEKVMLMQTTGHIWLKEEVEGTTNLQREFNNYLDSFRSIVVYAAQVYGFYHEIDRLVDNLGGFTKQLDKHPSNALAVTLSAKRNKIYRELIMGSVEIVNDIRLVCLVVATFLYLCPDVRHRGVLHRLGQPLQLFVHYLQLGADAENDFHSFFLGYLVA